MSLKVPGFSFQADAEQDQCPVRTGTGTGNQKHRQQHMAACTSLDDVVDGIGGLLRHPPPAGEAEAALQSVAQWLTLLYGRLSGVGTNDAAVDEEEDLVDVLGMLFAACRANKWGDLWGDHDAIREMAMSERNIARILGYWTRFSASDAPEAADLLQDGALKASEILYDLVRMARCETETNRLAVALTRVDAPELRGIEPAQRHKVQIHPVWGGGGCKTESIACEEVMAAFEDGYTIGIRSAQARSLAIAQFCSALQRDLQQHVNANIYCACLP
ncbi:hypothetical protein BBJ28_00021285 [Nothophytophthora sp. Chile5]|nr:hypothetical protein BBJ28_00021285 [Nothophytophthora sp. Chile5]